MKPSVSVQVRVRIEDAKLLKRAARARGMKLAAYVRFAALQFATYVSADDVDFAHDTVRVAVSK